MFIYTLTQWFYVALCSDIQHKQLSMFQEGECSQNGNQISYFAILWHYQQVFFLKKALFLLTLS